MGVKDVACTGRKEKLITTYPISVLSPIHGVQFSFLEHCVYKLRQKERHFLKFLLVLSSHKIIGCNTLLMFTRTD